MADDFIPVFCEGDDDALQLVSVVERSVSERAPSEDPKPDFHLIEPTTVLGSEYKFDARMSSEPSCSLGARTGTDVVCNDHEPATAVETGYMVEEGKDEGRAPVWRYPDDDVARPDIERSKYVSGAVSFVLELNAPRLCNAQGAVAIRAPQCLHPRLFVKAQHGRLCRWAHV